MIDGQRSGNTTIGTALSAIPGVAIGLGVVWLIGSREPRLRLSRRFQATLAAAWPSTCRRLSS